MTEKPIHQVLADVMADIRSVGKDDYNPKQNFKFRGIDAIINTVGPALRSHRVVVVPHASAARYRDVRTSLDKPSRECTVLVTYRFWGPAGDYIDVEVPGESMDVGDKGTPKAMSVAYRIALIQALCLPTDDRDPDHDSYERAEPPVDDTEALRAQIRNVGQAMKIPLELISRDFQTRAKEDIRTANASLLGAYLQHLRTNGLTQEQSA